jgi:hypothetical protein
VRVIGRLPDLERRGRRPGERRFFDEHAHWSFAGNGAWLAAGVAAREPFLQVSTSAPGSVLAWELAELRRMGCERVGPVWAPRDWFADRACYRQVVRLVAAHLLAQPCDGEPVWVPKARAELEPLLAMWPHVVLLPTARSFAIDELIEWRAWPLHPLGVVAAPTRADGRVASPAEFFFHDVDHARFKVREDLLARGITIDDPYRDGSTFDRERGAHRCVMHAAAPHVDGDAWRRAPARAALVQAWLAAIVTQAASDGPVGEAALWLLFELVHEKSLPIEPRVLAAALATTTHVDKLRRKCDAGFYAAHGPAPAVVAALERARAWLAALVAERA